MDEADFEVAKGRAREIAIGMYVGEPCRVCGLPILRQHIEEGAVFAGYSSDSKARSAHAFCWKAEIPQSEWAHR